MFASHIDQLKHFIQTVTNYRSNPKALTKPALIKIALNLLDELPASREIIFEYFALLGEIAVQSYVSTANVDVLSSLPSQQQSNNKQNSSIQRQPQEDESYGIVQIALQNLVTKGPPAWSPLIASWCLDLAGSLSEKYTQRRMPIGVACNYWLNCNAMRGLLTLINMCFRKLTNIEAESCVETLLAAFQRYPLSYDWVVARLGGCFPQKIISQILQCGIRRFSEDVHCHLDSEIGILDYLSFAHEKEQKIALRDMLLEGLDINKTTNLAVIPFLLIVSSYSETILQNLVSVFQEIYDEELCEKIIQKAPLWMANKIFADMQPSLNNTVLRLQQHGTKLLMVAAQKAEEHMWCQDFLEYSLQELEQVVLNARLCPLITDLSAEETKQLLWHKCLSENIIEQQTAVRLLLIVSTQHPHIYHQTISELLRKSYTKNTNGFGSLVRIMGGQSGIVEFPDIMPGLKMVLEDITLQEQVEVTRLPLAEGETSEAYNTINNLNILTKLLKQNTFFYINPQLLPNALNECLPKFLQILEVTVTRLLLRISKDAAARNAAHFRVEPTNNNNIEDFDSDASSVKKAKQFDRTQSITAAWQSHERDAHRLRLVHAIVELLNNIEAASKNNVIRTPEVLKLAVLSVKYFFIGLTEHTITSRAACAHRIFALLQRQCSVRKAARTACLRELLEGSLFYYGFLYGQFEEPVVDELAIPANEMVMYQNQNQTSGANSNRTVLHSGVIGRGLRTENAQTAAAAADNDYAEAQSYLLKALYACCLDPDKPNNIEGYSLVSLMLVELVSTDVMYNGLPFPDEEFTKVTMERDLLIRRAFITSPVLWAVLGFLATHRPSLCYSSVLLRALCATCLHQWRAKNVNKLQVLNRNDELMQCTIKLLELLAASQLLPPPLVNLHMIIEHFEPPEIALLLRECIWNYLKDHVPSPALFQVDNNGLYWRNHQLNKVPPQYVETLRHLMQKKLSKLGAHYHQMFIMCELNVPTSPTDATTAAAAETVPIIVLPDSDVEMDSS